MFVGIIMGSMSDWNIMESAAKTLKEFRVPYEARVVSAHRTPNLLFEYAETAKDRGIQVIIAGAGGSAHLAGMTASKTTLPVIGVPIPSILSGIDSLLSIGQMPKGIAVATMSIGESGAVNAALFAVQILSLKYNELNIMLEEYRLKQTQKVLENTKIQEILKYD